MNPKQIGERIASARKELRYTQKEVADKLHVSDKAISKWERGVGCPDISLLVPLCEILQMDVSTLLGEEKKVEETKGKEKQMYIHLSTYAKMKISENQAYFIKIAMLVFIIASFVAIGICLCIDYGLHKQLTWSLTVFASIVYANIIVITLASSSRYRIEKTMVVAQLFLFPLLYVISWQAQTTTYFSIAYTIALAAVVFSWLLYWVILHLHFYIWYRIALVAFLSMWFNLFVGIVAGQNELDVCITTGGNLAGVIACMVIGLWRSKQGNKGL